MLINNTRIITSRLAVSTHYYFSITQYTKNLLDSQFHLKGRAMPGMNRGRLYNSNIPIQLIRKIQDQLQTKRSQLPPTLREQQISSLKPENKQSLSQYTQSYLKLIKALEPLPVTNNHVCSIIAWYNLADHYKQMFKRLLESQSQDIKILLQYLSWMNYQWNNDYGVIDSDISLGQPIRNFYKKIINLQLDIHNLQQIEAVVVGPVYYEKRRFYEIYLNRHAQTFFGSVDPSQSEIEQYVWLVQTYTKSMNDDGQVHSMMEQFLLKHKQKLKASSILKLMNIYQLTGNINKDLYEQIIKPYIYRHKMGKLGDVIQTIKFAICSECQDNQLLKTLYELVQSLYLKTKYINTSRHLYILHQYTHYLLIKGYKIKLHDDLQKNIVKFCRQRAQSRLNINHLIAAQSKQEDKYVSPCLNQVTVPVKQYEQTKYSKFQEEFLTKLRKIPFDDHTFHQKPVLCCFQLDFCLQHKQSHQIHDLQIEGLQYMLKSGKHIRQRQIRDQILKHYNIQVHHLDFSFIRNKEYTSLDDFFKRAPKKE